ncbi:hypothetical protein RSAG8_09637, partial [Rhizoctonia solani AG-8 WAC10335]
MRLRIELGTMACEPLQRVEWYRMNSAQPGSPHSGAQDPGHELALSLTCFAAMA